MEDETAVTVKEENSEKVRRREAKDTRW